MAKHTLKHWSARRAGAAITVTGNSSVDGALTKITGVTAIEPRRGGLIVAVGKDGIEHDLVVG